MSSKYRLKEGVYLVTGALRGAILDTNTGLVYSVNDFACKVCMYQIEDDPYWQTLVSMGIAEQAEPACYQELPGSLEENPLRFVWFEIVTNDCNQHCIHCYSNSMPPKNRSMSSAEELPPRAIPLANRMSYRDWKRAIKEAKELGCKACQFIGGEPLLYQGENGESVLDLAEFAKLVGYSSIEIFTNATLLTTEIIQKMKEFSIKAAVSLYSSDPLVHDRITRTPGSHKKTLHALELLKKFGVETRVETIVMKANQETVESTMAFVRKMGLRGRKPDPVRHNGRGEKKQVQPDNTVLVQYGYTLSPNFSASKEKIARYRVGNPCLMGKCAITEFGEILPCIFAREHVLGNYQDHNHLGEIIQNQAVKSIWSTTKDHVAVCKDCEYRYVCFDCRPLAESVAGGGADFYHAPYPRCTYNPYTGQWGDGAWSLDMQGEPYYDQSLADDIKHVRQAVVIS